MISKNLLACRRYYDRNKDDSEFMKRKAVNTMRYYYKKKCHILYKRKHPSLWGVFRAWKLFVKTLSIKTTVKATELKVFKKMLEGHMAKQNKKLLKRIIDAWKEFERSPTREPIICSF